MFRKKDSLPESAGSHYLTLEFLKKLKNGKRVQIKKIIHGSSIYHPLPGSKLKYWLSDADDPHKSTFVRYERDDGKPEEARLDKLLQVRY